MGTPGAAKQIAVGNCIHYEEAATFPEQSCQVSCQSEKIATFGGELIVADSIKNQKKTTIQSVKHMHKNHKNIIKNKS